MERGQVGGQKGDGDDGAREEDREEDIEEAREEDREGDREGGQRGIGGDQERQRKILNQLQSSINFIHVQLNSLQF